MRRLCRGIIANRRTDLNRLFDGLHVAQTAGARLSLHIGQCPVVAVVRDAHEQLIRRHLRHGKPHDLLYLVNRRDRHRSGQRVTPFIGHQQGTVRRRAERGIVVRFIQKTLLRGGGFRCECREDRVSGRREPLADRADERGIRVRVLRRHIFEINVHTGEALHGKHLCQIFNQRRASRRGVQQPVGAFAGELPVLAECCQHEQRLHLILPRHAHEQLGRER